MRDPDTKLLIAIVLITGAVVAWFFRDEILPPAARDPVILPPEPVVQETPIEEIPIHPLAPPAPSKTVDVEIVPLPPLDESDSDFLLAMVAVFGEEIERVLVSEALIDKFVATVDNLTRTHVAEKIRPVNRLLGTFAVDAAEDDGHFYLNPENYERYDALVALVSAADPDDLAETYRRFYPLFQQSYERLGYPDKYFNDRVVEVIDHLLATPEVDEPIALVRPHVLYKFEDAQIEALSNGQKLLLRMGDEHTKIIKEMLMGLRDQIAQQ